MKPESWRWLLGVTAAVAFLYATGINRNLFFLAFALSCMIVTIVWAQAALIRLAAALVFLGSAAVSVSAPLAPRVDVHTGLTDGLRRLPDGVPITFRFALDRIAQHRAQCGALRSYAVVIGTNLPALELSANGAAPLGVEIRHAHNVRVREAAWARLPDDIAGTVELRLVPRHDVALYQGPEVSAQRVYPDGVFLMFENARCRVVYHARRAE